MEVTVENITDIALTLPRDEKVELANRLYESIDNEPISDEWRAEIRRRVAEIDSGEVELIDADVVFAEARARLRK